MKLCAGVKSGTFFDSQWQNAPGFLRNPVFGVELRFYAQLDTKWIILETFLKPNSWLGMEKLNPTQQN